MTFIFFLLNIIQAAAEFLPISSSGHIIVLESLYGVSEKGLEAFLHLPTTLAIAIVFWKSFLLIFKKKETWLPLMAAILPAGIVGFILGDAIDAIFYSPVVVGINLIVWGIVLFLVAKNNVGKKYQVNSWEKISAKTALSIGLLQILALIPGTSRSGITTLAGIWNGVKPQESARFSFIAGFPLIAAASTLGFLKMLSSSTSIFNDISIVTIILAMTLSLGLGILLVKLFTSKQTLTVMKYSGIYRIILGTVVLLWLS